MEMIKFLRYVKFFSVLMTNDRNYLSVTIGQFFNFRSKVKDKCLVLSDIQSGQMRRVE